MPFQKILPARRSIRLAGFDYSSAAWSFITLVMHARSCTLGMVEGNTVRLRPLGAIVAEHLAEIPAHFPRVRLDASVVMPNHVHAILEVASATPCRRPPTLMTVVGVLKSSVSRAASAAGLVRPGRVWQRSFFDRIIRDDDELNRLRQYIAENPARWADDRLNPSHPL